jgi:signal transduction histidine kinase
MALERVAQWLDRAVREGREALHSLRTSDEHIDLVESLRRAAQSHGGPQALAVTVSASGPAKPIIPRVRDDVFRIGEEAIRNVCAHALATSLDVELQFGRDLILSVRDDGKGIDHDAANRGREGHFGVPGMHERATQIGGVLTIQGAATGTQVTLVVPGNVAFT